MTVARPENVKNGEIYQIAKGNGRLSSLIPEKQRITETTLRNEEDMDEKKTGMGLLRDAVRLCAEPGKAGCGVAYALGNGCGDHKSCSECVGASLATIADRIEREREDTAEEAREVAGRLRGMRGYESRHANFNLIYLACFGFDAPLPTTDREDFAAVRDRLCDLIEHGGKRDPEREKAADWVEANGGLDEVSGKLDAYDAMDDERGYLMELRAEVSARLGVGLDGIAPAEAHARMLGELDKRTEALERYARMLNRIDSLLAGDEQECFAADTPPYDAGELFGAMLGVLGKRLMPLGMEWPPKDCEGEDLHIGEKAHFLRTGYDGDHEWDDVIVAFRHQGVEGEGDAWIVVGEEGEAFACDCAVERPAVFAADGLPIREGETVYSINDGKRATVKSLFGNIGLQMESDDGDCFETAPLNLTHERPVLGADGLPIKVGETVWYDGAEYVVDRVYTASDGDCSVDLEFGDLRSATNVWPQLIDHTPPDTQERIDDDATMPPRTYYAKHIGHDVGLRDDAECTEAMVRHLLNRQRGLDKRMMGGAE